MKNYAIASMVATFATIFLLPNTASAQQQWNLERCIQQAMQNNLNIKTAEVSAANSDLSLQQARAARLPFVSANGNYGVNLGRSINPATNAFETQTSQFSSIGVSGGFTLYNGGLTKNSILQAEHDLAAARAEVQQASENTALSVAQAYLTILFADEQLAVAKRQLDITKEQLSRTEKLIAAGALPQASRYDLQAQQARENQRIVAAENDLDIAYLNIKHLLRIAPNAPFDIERTPLPQLTSDVATLDVIYNLAKARQPSIVASEARLKSAEKSTDIARAAKLPTVSLGASVGSNYSDVAKNIIFGDNMLNYVALPIIHENGSTETIQFPQFSRDVRYEDKSYFNQIDENLGGGISLSVQMPIYDRKNAKITMERAKLSVTAAALRKEQVEQDLRTAIQRAITDVRAAEKQLDAARLAEEAARMAFENAEKRYQIGAGTFFEYSSAKMTLANTQSDVLRARYDHVFKLKILDFYQGKPIGL